ncbi:MAG: YggT family protein [Acidobacteriota bacterium]
MPDDNSRKAEQDLDVKSKVRQDVNREVEEQAGHFDASEEAKIARAARHLKAKTIDETVATESRLEREQAARGGTRVLAYIFGIIYGLIGLQIMLELFGAREEAAFKQFMNTVTYPLLEPFRGLMPDPQIGSFQLMMSYLIALFVYFLLHRALRGLLKLFVHET